MIRAIPGLEPFCQGCNINLAGGYAEQEADHNAELHAVIEQDVQFRRAIAWAPVRLRSEILVSYLCEMDDALWSGDQGAYQRFLDWFRRMDGEFP